MIPETDSNPIRGDQAEDESDRLLEAQTFEGRLQSRYMPES